MLLIYHGHILDPYTGMDAPCDLLIDQEGRIVAMEEGLTPDEAARRYGGEIESYDAAGLLISPGLVDVHVHFRDPGQTDREDLYTGARAAAAGGYTTVVCMANTSPVVDTVDTLRYVTEKAAKLDFINIRQACAITMGLNGHELTDFEGLLAAGAAGFTDDGVNLSNAGLCRLAMERAAALDTLLSFHEEDKSLVPSAGVNYGSAAARRFGVPGARAEAEECMVARDIALALRTGARVSFQHISSAGSVQLIRSGKALGARIYAEATPHHISLTEDAVLQHGTNARMNPPLRREEDRQALIEGLCDGTIDMLATDHAPHTAKDKARDFAGAPSGIIGLETAFSVCNTYLVRTGRMSRMALMRCMSCNPARIYGLQDKAIAVGNRAELMLADWDAPVQYGAYKSKSSNSPYTNMPLWGAVRATVMGNKVI